MSDDKLFERKTRTWLELGPTAAPRRPVEAALAAIASTPQQRALRFPWRLPHMTPRIRFALATAVGVTALLVVGALLQRPQAQVGTPSPTPTVAPSPVTLQAVQAMWASVGMRDDPMLATEDIEQALTIDQAGLRINGFKGDITSTASIDEGTGQLALELTSDQVNLDSQRWQACTTGDRGTYRLALSTDEQVLSFISEGDVCSAREGILEGDWTRWSCPPQYEYAFCPHLKDEAPGRHVSSVLKPFGGGASGQFAWTATDPGWVTLSAPPTWPELDTASAAWLYRPGAAESGFSVIHAVGVFSNVVPSAANAVPVDQEPATPCDDGIRFAGVTAADIADWLESLPYLAVTNRKQVTIGGLGGVQLDVSLVDGFLGACETDSSPEGGVVYRQDIRIFDDHSGTGAAFSLGPDGTEHAPSVSASARFIVLDTGEAGRYVVIQVPAPADGSGLDTLLVPAMPLISSFEFIP